SIRARGGVDHAVRPVSAQKARRIPREVPIPDLLGPMLGGATALPRGPVIYDPGLPPREQEATSGDLVLEMLVLTMMLV
ncbi:MAG: hypothetical protein MI919_26330, partial [Holophagales bacterium]|nr:hypothetical protein [Holophagales bacterium]